MVTYPGAMNNLDISDISDEAFSKAKHLHFSSYYLQPGIRNDVGLLFEKAKQLGLTTSFDMQWDPDEKWDLNYKEVLPNVDIFLPNEQELLNLTGKDDLDAALNDISQYSNSVAVKMGNKGSLLYSNKSKTEKNAYLNNQVVDAIGAGDSFNAGFIFKFIQGEPLDKCQNFGNLIGAINTTAAGGTTAFTNYNNIMKIAKEKFNYSE